jgi:hypothetical protein
LMSSSNYVRHQHYDASLYAIPAIQILITDHKIIKFLREDDFLTHFSVLFPFVSLELVTFCQQTEESSLFEESDTIVSYDSRRYLLVIMMIAFICIE